MAVKGELGTRRNPIGPAVGRTQQIQVIGFLKIGRQGNGVARHLEGVNAIGIGRQSCGYAIIGNGYRVEDVTIGSSGLEAHRLALVGVILSAKVGKAIDEVKLAAISRAAYRVDIKRLQENSRNMHVIGRHLKTVVVTEVAGIRRLQGGYSSRIKVCHCHRVNTPTLSRANKEGHILILL